MPSIRELRAEAKQNGIPWREVAAYARELQERELEGRGLRDEIRIHAWHYLVGSTSGSAPFWRHGFLARYGKRVDAHDYSVVPGYDEIHDSIIRNYGAFEDDEEGCFRFLFSRYEPRTPWSGHCADALYEMIDMAAAPPEPPDELALAMADVEF